MDLRSIARRLANKFFEDRATIQNSLGLQQFLSRSDYKTGSAEKMIKKQARHLRKQMDYPLDHKWAPQIVENEEKVVKMRRAK